MLPIDGGAFGQDGDPALLFQVARIHGALFHALVVAEGAGLAEKLVDKRRLAMIDVGDDRHVAEAHSKIPDRAEYRAPIRAILRRNKGTFRARIDIMDSGSERELVRRSYGKGASSEGRRGGIECVRTCKCRGWAWH